MPDFKKIMIAVTKIVAVLIVIAACNILVRGPLERALGPSLVISLISLTTAIVACVVLDRLIKRASSRRSVTRHREGNMAEAGSFEMGSKPALVMANILDPMNGIRPHDVDAFLESLRSPIDPFRREEWTIGIHLSTIDAMKFRDPSSGELYAIIVYQNGDPKRHLVPREVWNHARSQMVA